MTGEEHRAEAEKLLRLANQGHNQGSENEDRLTAQAQVHATLYLAEMQAATGRAAMLQLSLIAAPTEGYNDKRERLLDLLSREREGWSV